MRAEPGNRGLVGVPFCALGFDGAADVIELFQIGIRSRLGEGESKEQRQKGYQGDK
jgi:hypothetical protein